MGKRARFAFVLLACANAALASGAAWITPRPAKPHLPDAAPAARALAQALVPVAHAPQRLPEVVQSHLPPGAHCAIALSSGHLYGEATQAKALGQVLAGHPPATAPGEAFARVTLPRPTVAKPTPGPRTSLAPSVEVAYRIHPGDTLFSIARAHYAGDASMFAAIYARNRAAIGPDRSNLPAGVTIYLPAANASGTAAPAPTPEPTHAPLPPKAETLAVWLSLPTPPAPPTPWPWRPMLAGGGTLLLWGLGGVAARRARRHALLAERRRHEAQIAARVLPPGPIEDLGALRSSWRPELAQSRVGAAESLAFDAVPLTDSRLGLFIGDATGQGAAAIAVRGLANALWRARASEGLSPATTLLELNRLLVEIIPQGDHLTAFYAQLDLLSGALTYAAAGHLGAYVQRANGELMLLGGRGLPLGVGHELFAERLEQGQQRLQALDTLWFFSDGLVKAENGLGEPFGFERLEACLQDGTDQDAGTRVAHVRDTHARFLGRQSAELMIACVRLAPTAQPLRTPHTQNA